MLDTFCVAELWRVQLKLPPFSKQLNIRVLAATHWLHHMVNDVDGDGPNVGANDGARLLQLADTPYRDYRPSVQLALALFGNSRAELSLSDHGLAWLGLPQPTRTVPHPGTMIADDGGFAMLRRGAAMAMLRYPRFRFRPSPGDALHLDLWLGGLNLLRDAGSYSYNCEPIWLSYFAGTVSHNTIQFDDCEQMPRISRFLFGNWLKTSFLEPLIENAQSTNFGAGYGHVQKLSHQRSISLADTYLRVIDKVAGFRHKAVLRWRLMPGEWKICNVNSSLTAAKILTIVPISPLITLNTICNHSLIVSTTVPIVRCEIVLGWESRHYLEKTMIPVLEIEINEPGTLTSIYNWAT
jgi:hypothetical protein